MGVFLGRAGNVPGMGVTAEQVRKADEARTGGRRRIYDVALLAAAADRVGVTFYQALALIEGESRNRNIWGGDVGPEPGRKDDGTFSGFTDLVTAATWRAFRHEVLVRGRPSNGVGPGQITDPGLLRQMEAEGLHPDVMADNLFFSLTLYWSYYRLAKAAGSSTASAIRWAGTWYNAGPDEKAITGYGDRLYARAVEWKAIVGVEDATG